MRQLAWLNTPMLNPVAPKAPRTTRARKLVDDGKPLPLPELGGGLHLVGYLMEAGPCIGTGMGPVPLSWGELDAWARRTGTPLAPWEGRLLRELSAAWVDEARSAEDADAPSPWQRATEPTAEQRATLSRRLGAALSAMARPDPRRRN